MNLKQCFILLSLKQIVCSLIDFLFPRDFRAIVTASFVFVFRNYVLHNVVPYLDSFQKQNWISPYIDGKPTCTFLWFPWDFSVILSVMYCINYHKFCLWNMRQYAVHILKHIIIKDHTYSWIKIFGETNPEAQLKLKVQFWDWVFY